MKRLSGKHLVVVLVAAILVMGGSGVAYAYFSSGGNGTGTAHVGSAATQGFDVTTDGVGTPVLPGSGPQGFDIDVQNITGQALYIGTVYLQVMTFASTGDAATSSGSDIPGCSASWFTVSGSWAFNDLVPALGTASSTTMAPPPPTIAMPAGVVDQNACQGVSVGIKFSTTPFGA